MDKREEESHMHLFWHCTRNFSDSLRAGECHLYLDPVPEYLLVYSAAGRILMTADVELIRRTHALIRQYTVWWVSTKLGVKENFVSLRYIFLYIYIYFFFVFFFTYIHTYIYNITLNNYPPKRRWRVVDIYRDAKP